MSCTRTHLRMAELGCLDSTPLRAVSVMLAVRPHQHFLDDNALGVRRTTEGVALEDRAQVDLVVLLVGPALGATTLLQVARGADSAWFAHSGCGSVSMV